jgi:putative component of toxin-antitoxin plasmid stabilization module
MIDVREYIDKNGQSAFGKWFDRLNLQAAAKVTTALEKIAKGNFSNVEPIGEGVSEYRVDWVPATASISARMAKGWSFWLAAARRSARRPTSPQPGKNG